MTLADSPGRMETLNDVQLYFEVHATGEPLMLLHGFLGFEPGLDDLDHRMGNLNVSRPWCWLARFPTSLRRRATS
jgi:hypothetical protein